VIGIPGLIHCLRRGTVAVVNGIGSQIADDLSLLAFSQQIVRFYLSESPIIPTVPTLWLGDIDQREVALENLADWRIQPVSRDRSTAVEQSFKNQDALRKAIRREPSSWAAQPREADATTLCFHGGRPQEHPFDQIVYGVRTGDGFELLPGGLTRVHTRTEGASDSARDWTSKDTWVLSLGSELPPMPRLKRRQAESPVQARQVTSRVAESFYWMGRYLERAHHQANLISVVETLETEELNSAERRHYRPMWNRLLPPLEKSAGTSRRSIANRLDRYRLVLLQEPGSVVRTFMRAANNADAAQDSLSPEASAAINELREMFRKTRYRETLPEAAAMKVTRKMTDAVTKVIPQFFEVSGNTMLADDGWKFCEIGKMLERAVITANSVLSISSSLSSQRRVTSSHVSEIELSAFLRLLGTRDAYRRIYQMRAEPKHVLELLWQNPQVPRSVRYCLDRCREALVESIAPSEDNAAPSFIDSLIRRIQRIEWSPYVPPPSDEDRPAQPDGRRTGERADDLEPLLRELLAKTLELHTVLSDVFLSHQARIAEVSQPLLKGM
jgi:uncharacterized alpha-E superfamily protein